VTALLLATLVGRITTIIIQMTVRIMVTILYRDATAKTLYGRIAQYVTYTSVCDQHPGQLSLAIPSWVGTMSTSQRAVWRFMRLGTWGTCGSALKFCFKTCVAMKFVDDDDVDDDPIITPGSYLSALEI